MQKKTMQKGVVGGLIALTLFAGIPPTYTSAQTPSLSELQAQIASLQATIAALSNKNTTTSALGAYTWNTTLRLGSTGEAVRELQRLLNSDPDTRVAMSGVGAPGNETTYYGPATAAAVAKFQTKYRADILTPNGLSMPTGVFGPASIAKANALRAAVVVPPAPPKPTTPTTPVTENDLSGEGELSEFTINDADDSDIQEAAADAVIAEIEMEADNGDIRITRLDVALTADAGNTEKDPWDTFEELSLWIDGEKIADKAIDRKTDYLNRKGGVVRFSNLDIVLEEGETVEAQLAATVQSSVDGAGSAATWSVAVTGMRYFDGDAVSTDERSTGDIGEEVSFSIVERGEGEELKFSLHRNNPEASTIIVDEDRKTNNVTVLTYEIEAIDADIELETLAVNLKTGTAAFADVVQAVRLEVDDESFRSDTITTTGSYSTSSVLATFDVDGDVTIDEGDVVMVRVIVDLKPQTAYLNGETIMAQITSAERDLTEAEGSDDIETFNGTVVGKTHRLIARGIDADSERVTFSTKTQGQNATVGLYTITFAVTAVEDDFFIKNLASTSASSTTGGVKFSIDGNPAADALSGTLSSTADETSEGTYVVREGETETFTLYVTFDPSTTGIYRAQLDALYFSAQDDGVTAGEELVTTPINKFRTPYQPINN